MSQANGTPLKKSAGHIPTHTTSHVPQNPIPSSPPAKKSSNSWLYRSKEISSEYYGVLVLRIEKAQNLSLDNVSGLLTPISAFST
jgi:hypothetical protein